MKNLYAECYRIAEIAHHGCDDDYIRDLCAEVADTHELGSVTAEYVYEHSKRIYMSEFNSH